jgi:hypothetical protein
MEFIQMHKLVKSRTYFFYLKLVNYLLSISPSMNINNPSILGLLIGTRGMELALLIFSGS